MNWCCLASLAARNGHLLQPQHPCCLTHGHNMVFSVCTVCVCVNVRTQRDPVGNWPGLPDGLSHRTIWDSFSGKTTRAGDFKVNGWQVIGWTICLSTNNTVRDKRLDRRTKGTSFFRRANFSPPEPGVSEHFYFWWRERERENWKMPSLRVCFHLFPLILSSC